MIVYTCDESKRTVTAKFDGDDEIRLNKGLANHPIIQTALPILAAKNPAWVSCKDMVGTAKCHPSDIFDPEVGKRLAKSRLLDKYCSKKIKLLGRLERLVYSVDSSLTERIQQETKELTKHQEK